MESMTVIKTQLWINSDLVDMDRIFVGFENNKTIKVSRVITYDKRDNPYDYCIVFEDEESLTMGKLMASKYVGIFGS